MTPALVDDGQPAWNRLIRFEDINGKERYGEPVDDDLDGTTPLCQ
ncbi:hypothetical protein TGAMA5MH_09673 [Trichoderma gamsii]|uniref:Uncharacterized protein n=1 Tax=Trichoderma gamsii TaxID=398673 RepID=A0A2K0SYG2_9HYPO|nr:hypothetical protein TGAMA5MH_09673 [Trichoderma gamsii]